MAMLKGQIDGDGYIEIGEQKQYNKKTKELVRSTIRYKLVLRLNIRDIKLIEYIFSILQIGKIDYIENNTQIRYIISKTELKEIFIPQILYYDLQFLTTNRIKQYNLLIYQIENKINHWDLINTRDLLPLHPIL